MKEKILEEICNISNSYDANPNKVLKIYNKYIEKHYSYRKYQHALELTNRYIGMNFELRRSYFKWTVKTIHYFEKEYKGD
jgi:hypothetical protein